MEFLGCEDNDDLTIKPKPVCDYTGKIFGSLSIIGCVDCNESFADWRCRCYLCGKEYVFSDYDFEVELSPIGWFADAYCDCYKKSSFQWAVTKLLFENDISYSVEYSFSDLLGCSKRPLRFDFAVFNEDGSLKMLIECQGEQHYKPVENFGGDKQFELQQQNDAKKREYAKQHNIPLLEISFKDKNIDTIRTILQQNGVL